MKSIQPCGSSGEESFITKYAQSILENQSTQSGIETNDKETEEFNMPVEKIAGLSEIQGGIYKGKYIRSSDSAKAFSLVLSS
jgi:hypothetical protein